MDQKVKKHILEAAKLAIKSNINPDNMVDVAFFFKQYDHPYWNDFGFVFCVCNEMGKIICR